MLEGTANAAIECNQSSQHDKNSAEKVVRQAAEIIGFGPVDRVCDKMRASFVHQSWQLKHLDAHMWFALNAPIGLAAAVRHLESTSLEVSPTNTQESTVETQLKAMRLAKLKEVCLILGGSIRGKRTKVSLIGAILAMKPSEVQLAAAATTSANAPAAMAAPTHATVTPAANGDERFKVDKEEEQIVFRPHAAPTGKGFDVQLEQMAQRLEESEEEDGESEGEWETDDSDEAEETDEEEDWQEEQHKHMSNKHLSNAGGHALPSRRSRRSNAGTRAPTFHEEYADDIRGVLLDGEDLEEIGLALDEEDDSDVLSLGSDDTDTESSDEDAGSDDSINDFLASEESEESESESEESEAGGGERGPDGDSVVNFKQMAANAPEDNGKRLGKAVSRAENMARMRAEKKKMMKWRETPQ
jgi:hypothetical protein